MRRTSEWSHPPGEECCVDPRLLELGFLEASFVRVPRFVTPRLWELRTLGGFLSECSEVHRHEVDGIRTPRGILS